MAAPLRFAFRMLRRSAAHLYRIGCLQLWPQPARDAKAECANASFGSASHLLEPTHSRDGRHTAETDQTLQCRLPTFSIERLLRHSHGTCGSLRHLHVRHVVLRAARRCRVCASVGFVQSARFPATLRWFQVARSGAARGRVVRAR